MLQVIEEEGFNAVALGENDTRFGAVETLDDALKCADLFQQNGRELDGFVITLPNFGDERAVANVMRWSGLNVPVLVHAQAGRHNARLGAALAA